MSGLLGEVGTPCPSRSSRFDRSSGRDNSFSKYWEDSLEHCGEPVNVDFTTEIKAPLLTGVKPRRRTKTESSFAIHDENQHGSAQAVNPRRRETRAAAATSNRKMSLLAQPAQRFRPKVNFAASPAKNPRLQGDTEKRGTKLDAEKNRELLMQINGNGRQTPSKDALKSDVRRNTVYIPPDDTTVASVFMGIFSPVKSHNMQIYVPEDTQINSLESQIAKKRQAKRSLASSAQQVPLQPSTKLKQESCIHVDVVGKNGGKENIPPGTLLHGKDKSTQQMKFDNEQRSSKKALKLAQTQQYDRHSAKPMSPLAMKSINGTVRRTMMGQSRSNANTPCVSAGRESNKVEKRKTNFVNQTPYITRSSILSNSLNESEMRPNLQKATSLRSNSKRLDNEYSLIRENITNPALYEDDWLCHQEVVITQLANRLLEQAHKNLSFDDPAILRHELLTQYQDTYLTHLYKRVQASLLYGAMSIPKNVLVRSDRLRQDVGMKRKFLDFWMKTYDPRALRAAMETVTGRRMPVLYDMASGSEKSLKRRLDNFLDTFLLQNQDKEHPAKDLSGGDANAAGMIYRRTVLRSIMIIILLDKARTRPGTVLPRCLFLPSSPLKSSSVVLQALARFLLPSSGDILKTLGRLNYSPVYEQSPIQEYEYQMSNLAVDLRDGVRLTRIVELLLYPSNSCSGNTLSDTGIRTVKADEYLGPLSQHLKLPPLSRTVKLFNVRIALNALACMKSYKKLVSEVRAEDIVDGHREKTIALLWGLVSKWALAKLIDWDDVRKEIGRLKEKAIFQFKYESVRDEEWPNTQDLGGLDEESDDSCLLLKQWASILARLKGLHIENLSTSFGDGKIYESIVDEYEGYMVGSDKGLSTEDSQSVPSLPARLRALGCSVQFGQSSEKVPFIIPLTLTSVSRFSYPLEVPHP
jgi:abnormal spindle-like microcephaly-associated protein